jgi:hypothetical protein
MSALYFYPTFYPNFSTSRYQGEKYVFLHETQVYFQTSKDFTRGSILYSKNNPHRTSSLMPLYTCHQFIASAFSDEQRSLRLRYLRSIHGHFHTEHQHFCTSTKFIRTDNIIQCVHKSTFENTDENWYLQSHNVHCRLSTYFYIIPNENAELRVYINHGTNTAFHKTGIAYPIRNSQHSRQNAVWRSGAHGVGLGNCRRTLSLAHS